MRPPLLPRDPELRDPLLREPLLREPLLREPLLRDPLLRDPLLRDPPPPPPLRRWASSMSAVEGAVAAALVAMAAKPAVGCRLNSKLMKPATGFACLLFIA